MVLGEMEIFAPVLKCRIKIDFFRADKIYF